MPPHKGQASLTDSERFSSDGSNDSFNVKKRLHIASSRRRVSAAVGDSLHSSIKSKSFHELSSSGHRATSRKSTSFCEDRSSSYSKVKNKSFDERNASAGRQDSCTQKRPVRKYFQESSIKEEEPRRRYVQESSGAAPSSSSARQVKDRRQSSSLRSSKTKPSDSKSDESKRATSKEEDLTADLAILVAENKALEAERATIEKYKRMYEAILQDPGNAFLFEGSVCGNESTGGSKKSASGEEDTFDAALNVEELIEGLKLKNLLHDSSTSNAVGSSESVSILSEIRSGDHAATALERYRPKSNRAVGRGNEMTATKSRDMDVKSRKSQCDNGEQTARRRSSGKSEVLNSKSSEGRPTRSDSKSNALDSSNRSDDSQELRIQRRPRSGSKSGSGALSSSMKSKSGLDISDRSHDEQQRRPRSGSKGGLSSSMRSSKSATIDNSNHSEDSQALVPHRRSRSKSSALDTSDRSDERHQRRKSRRQTQEPLTSSGTSHKSRQQEDKDCVSVKSNTSTGSRFSFTSNADRSVADESDYDNMTDVEDDVVPDLNSSYEKKEKKGLFRTMKKFGKKVSKALNGGSGVKKYKVGEVARYNIGKIRDSLESFDPQDPTVEVVIVAVHIDAVLEIPYYTIQLPDGSRKQTNMENLISLEDYNNGTRPYARIKEKRSSSRRRSSRRDEEDDDRSVSSSRSNRSTRSTQSNRSTNSSSSRRSSRQTDYNESPERDDRSVHSSSSRHRSSSRSGHKKDKDYRPRVDSMRGGGMALPDKGANLKRADKSIVKDNGDSDEEPVIIKLTSRNSVGSSFALDAAVAAAVGVRRSSAVSSSRSCCGASAASNSYNKSYSSLSVNQNSCSSKPPVVVELSPKKTKPPTVVELSPSKKSPATVELSPTKKSKKRDVVQLSPTKKSPTKPLVVVGMTRKIRHANTMDDATVRVSRSGSSSQQKQRSRSTGPPKQNSYPKGTCSKCDGCHKAIDCPIYLKDREKHKDSWRYYGEDKKKRMGEDGGNKHVRANRIKQPADGSCLFHSLVYCFNSMKKDGRISSSASVSSSSTSVSSCVPPPLTASHLRKKIARFIAANPNLNIADDPLKEWVLWDSGQTVEDYAAAMAVGGWGGGIEVVACSQILRLNIHIYEKDPKSTDFVRISCFNHESKTDKTLHLLYHGRNHYDALQLK